VHRHLKARGLILIYHRVTEERNDPWRLGVTPERFADQLETLRGLGLHIVPVSQLARELAEGRPRRRSIALSFDDGYQDNLTQARPLLERFEIPATLFATSGYIGSGQEFWWDVLEQVFLQPGELPPALDLIVGDESYHCDLGVDAKLTPARSESLLDWKPFQEAPTARHRAHDELWQEIAFLAYHLHWDLDRLLDLEHGDRIRLLQEVGGLNERAWQGVSGG